LDEWVKIRGGIAINRLNGGLFELFHLHHFNPGIAYINDLKLVIINNDAFFLAGNGLVVIDNIPG
jgi:hypothetical protein